MGLSLDSHTATFQSLDLSTLYSLLYFSNQLSNCCDVTGMGVGDGVNVGVGVRVDEATSDVDEAAFDEVGVGVMVGVAVGVGGAVGEGVGAVKIPLTTGMA